VVAALTGLSATPAMADAAKATVTIVQSGNSSVKISGAAVHVYNNPTSQATPAYDQTQATNAQGRASFGGLVDNSAYLVQVSKEGCTFPNQDQNIGIPPNKTSVTKTMLLDCPQAAPAAKATITIVQKGNSKVKISGASVRVYTNPTSQATPAYDKTDSTDSLGRAHFGGLVAGGVYLVAVTKRGCSFPGQDQNLGVPITQTSITKTMLLECP
jgi:hypothetical protein